MSGHARDTVLPGRADRRRSGRFDLLGGRTPRAAHVVLLLLVAAGPVVQLTPGTGPAVVAPGVLLALVGPLWVGRAAARVHVLLAVTAVHVTAVGAVAGPLTDLPASAGELAGSLAVLAALLACVEVVTRCSSRALESQAAVLRERAAHDTALQRESELADRLEHRTTHDALTGLLNRAALVRVLDDHIGAGRPVGVLVATMARFTEVNDLLGDELGDEALTVVGRRLAGAARGTDLVARLGGDQFAVVLPGVRSDGAEQVGERLAALLREPVALGGQVLPLRARVGLTLAVPGTPENGRALLRAAEIAARDAVPSGACVRRESGQADAAAELLRGESDLARGLRADELFLLYQPLVSTATGRIASTEALVRWRHPERGLVPPDDFIGLAEATGLIVPLGLRVLELACAQLRQWSDTSPDLTVAVNVSARQLVEPDFVDAVRRVLWSSGVDPARVVLELTESLLVEDGDAAVAVLWQLRGLGVRLALDDFGTGYSSLARLGDLPLDEMKIDKSFVDRLGVVPGDSSSLVTAAVAMGHGLGLAVVAEGVETTEQADFLQSVGADLLQGYLLGKPLPAEQVTTMLGRTLLPAAPAAVPTPRSGAAAHVAPRGAPDRSFVPGVLPSLAPRRAG